MSTMLMPDEYISGIRDMNMGRQTANMIGTPVKVESATALRAAAMKQKAETDVERDRTHRGQLIALSATTEAVQCSALARSAPKCLCGRKSASREADFHAIRRIEVTSEASARLWRRPSVTLEAAESHQATLSGRFHLGEERLLVVLGAMRRDRGHRQLRAAFLYAADNFSALFIARNRRAAADCRRPGCLAGRDEWQQRDKGGKSSGSAAWEYSGSIGP